MICNRPHDLVTYQERNVAAHPDRVALICNGESLTFAEFYDRCTRLAANFVALGLSGRAVGIFTPTRIELLLVYYAGFMSGTTIVPINYSFKPQELQTVLGNCSLSALIVDSSLVGEAHGAGAAFHAIPLRYVIGGCDSDGFLPFAALESSRRETIQKVTDQPALIFHTSGTTGTPKGVVHTLASASYFAHCYQTLVQGEEDPVTLIARNCYHSGGFYHLTGALSAGTTCVLADDPSGFDAEAFVALAAAHRVTQFFLSVPLLNAILRAKSLSPRTFERAAFVSAGADEVKAFHHEELAKYARLPLTVRYSSTEATCVSISDGGDRHTTGRPFAHFQWRLDPQSDGGGIGELWLRGPAVFRGYLNNAGANATSFVDGWYKTGDLFRTDAEGRLAFCGRKNDSMKVGGKFVYPEEIETVANTYPAFAETVAVPVPHGINVEVPYLFARLRSNARPFAPSDFSAFMRERVASYKVPVQVKILADFPRTAGGKIDRRFLKSVAARSDSLA